MRLKLVVALCHVLIGILLLPNLSIASTSSNLYQDFELKGSRIISKESFSSYLPVRFPAELGQDAIKEIIRSLYKTGFFQQIEVLRLGDKLVFNIIEQFSIGKIYTEGNTIINEEQLKKIYEQAGLEETKFLNEFNLDKVVLSMLSNYHNEGYYNAKVDYEVIPTSPTVVDVNISIKEGVWSRIDKIQITGAKTYAPSKLKSLFLLTEDNFEAAFSNTDRYSKFKFLSDLQTLNNYYLDNGFAKFSIDSSEVALSPSREHVYISINISEGEQYYFGKINLDGNFVVAKEVLLEQVEMVEGEIFNRSKIIKTINNIKKTLGEDGYTYAQVIPNQVFDDENFKVDFTLMVEPGNQIYVNKIIIRGNYSTMDKVIRREFVQLEGAPYSLGAVEISKSNVERLGFFASVTVKAENLTSDLVNIIVTVEEQPTGTFEGGIGYSQSTGASYRLGLNEKNTFGTGWGSGINFEASESSQVLNLSTTNPYVTLTGHSLTTNVFYSQEDTADLGITSYNINRNGLSFSYGIPIAMQVRFSMGASYKSLDLTCGSSSFLCNDFVEANNNKIHNTELSLGLTADSRNSGVFPTSGAKSSLFLETTLPSDKINFYKLILSNRYYKSLTEDLTFGFKSNLSFGQGYGQGSELPFYEKFFAGGLASVRGFYPSSLGEYLEINGTASVPMGGSLKTIGNFELIAPPFWTEGTKNVRTVLFFDIGSVYSNVESFDVAKLSSSYGVAINWLTPVGPMTFSLADIYKKASENESKQSFQFALGTSF